jgi:type IV pilus assembly protein PilN
MIRINLLSDGKKSVTRKKRASVKLLPAAEDRSRVLLTGAVLLGLLAYGIVYWIKDRQVKMEEGRVAAAEIEVQRLQAIIKEVEDFKAKKAALEHKIEVITQLKQNQQGPVRIMDMVSRALPELLWLDRLELSTSNLVLTGQALNTNAVAAFMDNLDDNPEFQEPVLRDVRQQGQAQLYSFVVAAGYSLAAPAAAAKSDAAAPTGAN